MEDYWIPTLMSFFIDEVERSISCIQYKTMIWETLPSRSHLSLYRPLIMWSTKLTGIMKVVHILKQMKCSEIFYKENEWANQIAKKSLWIAQGINSVFYSLLQDYIQLLITRLSQWNSWQWRGWKWKECFWQRACMAVLFQEQSLCEDEAQFLKTKTVA